MAHNGVYENSDKTSSGKVAEHATDEKHPDLGLRVDPESLEGETGPLETAEDIVTHVIAVDDDPTLSPWTFRMFFVGEWPSPFPLQSKLLMES